MHLFCLALLYQVRPGLETMVDVPAFKVRTILGECLDNMKLFQRTSVLFRRARIAIQRFVQRLDWICKLNGICHRRRYLMLSAASAQELNTPSALASENPRTFTLDFTQYDMNITNDLLGQAELDLLLADGLYC